jgi:polyphosphate kinase
MDRNLDRRVEALVRVTEPTNRRSIARLLELAWSDDIDHWALSADGSWTRTPRRDDLVDLQSALTERALDA